MSVQEEYISAESYTERQKKSVARVLSTLEREEERLGEHYSQERSCIRKPCHQVIEVRVGTVDKLSNTFKVFLGDVSGKGLNFIYPEKIECSEILVGIHVKSDHVTWIKGKIVRSKHLPDDHFWDYGVMFETCLVR